MKVLRPRPIIDCSRSQRMGISSLFLRKEGKGMRTLRVCFACAPSFLPRRFQRTPASLKRTVFIRLKRLVEIILRCYNSRGRYWAWWWWPDEGFT
jgi:hypothetical protein